MEIPLGKPSTGLRRYIPLELLWIGPKTEFFFFFFFTRKDLKECAPLFFVFLLMLGFSQNNPFLWY